MFINDKVILGLIFVVLEERLSPDSVLAQVLIRLALFVSFKEC